MTSFEEEQRLAPWLIQLVYGVIFLAIGITYFTLQPGDDKMMALIAMAPALIIVTLLFTSLRMKTRVTGDGVHIKTLYFVSRLIPFEEIEQSEAVQYKPLRDFGGWGLRISHKGKAYNMRGDRGVQLHLTENRRVLIGSQRDRELVQAIEAGMRGR